MAKRTPTDGELAILNVLWKQGPCTVRHVHQALHGGSAAAYTSTLKLMQIMHDKGLVERDASQRSHVFRAAVAESQVQRSLVNALMKKAFGGSASQMVLRALSSKKATKQELDEIRAMLDELQDQER